MLNKGMFITFEDRWFVYTSTILKKKNIKNYFTTKFEKIIK